MNASPPKPTFIIVGAARSGTSSLYRWLSQHPQVFMSPVKETNYFAQLHRNFTGPGDDYFLNRPLSQNPDGSFKERGAAIVTSWSEYLALFSNSERFVARGEASPSYLYYPNAAKNIWEAIPDCKTIILLRNPVDRAFSHYKALVRWGRESLDFESAWQAEEQRLQLGWEWCWALKGASFYSSAVKRYFDTFPRDQIGVWLYEELKDDPIQFYRQVCRLIDVDDKFTPDFTQRNVSLSKVGVLKKFLDKHIGLREVMRKLLPVGLRSAIRAMDGNLSGKLMVMRPETRTHLVNYFYEDIVELDRLLPEHDVTKWLGE